MKQPAHLKIRRAVIEDASHLPALFEDAIHQIASRYYTPDQVNAWAGRSHRIRTVFEEDFSARSAWVTADQSGRLFAYIDLETSGHIDFFYARPEVTRTSVTRDMYALLEATARDQGLTHLSTEASEATRRFFQKQGFQIISRQDVIIGEVSIHNYVMEKILPAA